MAAAATPADLDGLRASVTKQAGLVRQMKKDGATQEDITKAVNELQTMRARLEALEKEEASVAKWPVDKRALDDTLTRRMFVVPAFEIHGQVAGLYDYGPPGAALKDSLLALWRRHFVLTDSLLAIECTTLTPYSVLKASGHVDKFEDLMVKDGKTGECFRADKLLEDVCEQILDGKFKPAAGSPALPAREEIKRIHASAGSLKKEQIAAVFGMLGIRSPTTGNELTPPFEFNLMFQTSIGPTGALTGFLRPETAQGMFVNFNRLYNFNSGRMPMGVAQIGSAYRNEIAPRGGLLRVREFTMAEIEFFVNPARKEHTKWDSVKDARLTLFPRDAQVGDGKTITPTLEEAVTSGIVDNQTLAYFMARTAAFLLRVGVKPEGLRFRQHLKTEMAHYACDCWDAEILMSSGWVECVGIADRSAYDLTVHAKATKTEMFARELLPEPVEEDVVVPTLNRGAIGKAFKGDGAAIMEHLTALAEDRDAAMAFQATLTSAGSSELEVAGKKFTIAKEMISYAVERKRVMERKYVPNVIEPSFGIGRIITGIFEHNFSVRDGDDQRAVLSFNYAVAPYKVVVLTLDGRIPRAPAANLADTLAADGIASYIDDSSATVGKRYARADELGVPCAITFDFDSLSDHTVTMRDRDTCAQIRLPVAEVAPLIRAFVDGTRTWADAMSTYKVVTTGEDKAASATASAAAPAASAPTHIHTHTSAAATPAASAAAPSTAGSATVGTVLEGADRTCGRFMRPATAI